MVCLPYRTPLYPINHLRNLAIQVTETTHVANLDIDLIPSGISISIILITPPIAYMLAGLYNRLCSLDFSEEKHKQIAYVISAFQFKYSVRKECTNERCFAYLRKQIPFRTDRLIDCMRRQRCQIMNRQLTTYVWLSRVLFCELANKFHFIINHFLFCFQ